MSEMIERVAKAIQKSIIDGNIDPIGAAVRAIQAMREPTELMLDAGCEADSRKSSYKSIWHGMIDAALAAAPTQVGAA